MDMVFAPQSRRPNAALCSSVPPLYHVADLPLVASSSPFDSMHHPFGACRLQGCAGDAHHHGAVRQGLPARCHEAQHVPAGRQRVCIKVRV
eukprot:1142693-Pelagomonas_calceolata.AAC.3